MKAYNYIIYALWVILAIVAKILGASWWVALSPIWFPVGVIFVILLGLQISVDIGKILSGRDDPCMLSERKFIKAIRLLDKVGYESVSHRLFDGMRHEILNEKNNMNVYKDIAKTLYSWLDRKDDIIRSDSAVSTVAEEEAAEEAAEEAEEAPAA